MVLDIAAPNRTAKPTPRGPLLLLRYKLAAAGKGGFGIGYGAHIARGWKPMLRIQSENGWLELSHRDDKEAFDVQVSVGDFAGRNSAIWIDSNVQNKFLVELRSLEHDRRGEARLVAMSLDEFELVIRVADALGHAVVEGLVGKLH